MPAHDLACLRAFRTALPDGFDCRAEALFALGDAVLASEAVASQPHLSLPAVHRRGGGSPDDALHAGRIDAAALRVLLLSR
jgi:hypothetical protein